MQGLVIAAKGGTEADAGVQALATEAELDTPTLLSCTTLASPRTSTATNNSKTARISALRAILELDLLFLFKLVTTKLDCRYGGLMLSRLETYLPLDLDRARCLLENIET